MKNSKWCISFLLVVFLSEWNFGQNTSFYMENDNFVAGQNIEVPVLVNDFDAVIGFQYTITWDPEVLDFQSIGGYNLDGLDQASFGYSGVEQGYLICTWTESSFNGVDVMDETVIFSMTFKVNCAATESGAIAFTDTPTDMLLIYEDENSFPVTSIPPVINGEYSMDSSDLNINPIISPISCAGQNDASIEANVTGGVAPYIYEWGTGGTTSSLDNIGPGSYFLLVTDANDCETIAPFITVESADSIHICTIDVSYDQSCLGTGACIDLTVCEPGDSLTYEWSNGMTTASICNLTEGEYAVTVTNGNGCSDQREMIVVEEGGYNPMAAQYIALDSTCAIAGMIDLSVANGAGDYSYSWSNGASEGMIENLAGGEYFCTVSDDICEIIVGPILVSAIQPDISIATDVEPPVCAGDEGNISVTAMSSAEPLTYLWNTGSEESNLENLLVGEYVLTITDANGCTFESDTFLIEDGATVSTTAIQIDSTSCDGLTDGSISVVPTGGTMPYTFEFSNGDTTNPATLGEGVYSLTITDDVGCTTVVENLEVFSPTAIEVSDQLVIDYQNDTNRGSIDLTVLGGTPPYTFNWSNGGTTNPLENLEVGTYACSITDTNNCELIVEGIVVDQILSVGELAGVEIRFYPNPARDYLYLETKKQVDFLEFYTIDGVMVKQYSQPVNYERIDIRKMKPGAYWIKVIADLEAVVMKIVILD